jgi:beta-glucanase (GH16 family)
MKKAILLTSILLVLGVYISCKKEETSTPAVVSPPLTYVAPKYSFTAAPVWQDEFDNTGLPDATKWDYDIGGSGWGNREAQYYTKTLKNAHVENGKLSIEALKENLSSNSYTSARMVTKGKGDWLYGKFEIRAKLPQGRGTWPAIWMLATNQTYGSQYWPDNGEIDIMEHVGFDPNVIHGSLHTKWFNFTINTEITKTLTVPSALSDFHNYVLEWYPDSIKVFVDDVKYLKFENKAYDWQGWPFNQKFHILLNVAVGGDWGGQKGIDDSIFPQKMEVDYVRVYGLKKE